MQKYLNFSLCSNLISKKMPFHQTTNVTKKIAFNWLKTPCLNKKFLSIVLKYLIFLFVSSSFIFVCQFLHDLLETCQFKEFWTKVHSMPEVVRPISGFDDSIRKFICHVIGITYQVSLSQPETVKLLEFKFK